MGLSWSKERERKYFYYTPAYNSTTCYLIAKQKSKINSIDDLSKQTVYLKKGSITHNMLQSRNIKANIVDKATIQSIYKELANADENSAMLAYFIDEKELEKYNLVIKQEIYDRYGEVSIGINHKYKELASIINKAFLAIPKDIIVSLRDKMDFQHSNKLK